MPSPGDGKVVAEIQIPAIGVDQYVVEGTTESDLSKGPGHYIGTAMPGQAGNVAIAGHRTTYGAPFNGLGRLVPGDRIILTTTFGQSLTYVVSGTPQAVSPSDVGVLNYFGDNRITLTTCNPEFSSTQRLVVVGKLKQPLASPAVKHLSYHVVNPAIASWNWSLLPAVGLEVCLLLLLALSYRRFGDLVRGNREVAHSRSVVGGRPLPALRDSDPLPSCRPLSDVRWPNSVSRRAETRRR